MRMWLGALPILACLPAPLFAGTPANEHEVCVQEAPCRMASNAELDELRGGFHFDTQNGRLRIGIGITRAVAVNDRFVAVSQLVVPDLGQAFAASRRSGHGQAPQVVASNVPAGSGLSVRVGGNAVIVQSGPNNVAPPASAFGAGAFPTIVQNTLDNQKLGTLTIVNASVNSLSVMNALRIGEMMRRATVASGR